ncbi:acetate uptake transporter family protein [Actinomadura welshii]|uniref:acetate uptake transporter family protein n=1 Tax=Actinomadura welshii TaxID=3103817 RepID=UPI001377CF72|nr:GPR1/FUN34/YaaH family transporter [Actinomadura madurae]
MARRKERAAPPTPGEHTGQGAAGQGMSGQGMSGQGMAGQAGGMATPGAATAAPGRGVDEPGEHAFWEDRTRIFLQPIAAPSILGLFGLATATMMVGAWEAEWYGGPLTPLILWPLVLFAGIAQILAGMWAYRARDGIATAIHGMWGAFWTAWGLLFALVSVGAFPAALAPVPGNPSEGFAFWYIALAAITGLCALAALAENLVLAVLLACLSAAAGFTAGGFWAPSDWASDVGGWLFVVTAVLALYAAAAMMMENTFGRTILPLFRVRGAAEARGRRAARPLQYRQGQPGVKIGQ